MQNNLKLKISVCITIFNETKETVDNLLESLNNQTLKPDEIIIIDAKDYDNCSRSKGRNIAIKKAKNGIIAITDAGCIPHKDWLYKITLPFKNKNIDVVAGGYEMVSKNSFEKAESIFLGVKKNNMNSVFLPSARSIAFTKSIWRKVGGFPEKLNDTAEDTLFNLELIKLGAKFKVVNDATVDWYMPKTIGEFAKKIYRYAKGDVKSKIWWHPVKKWGTHNLKILGIILRYIILFLILLNFGIFYFLTSIFVYCVFAFNKAGLWGIILQFTSDFAGIIGFSHGILSNSFKRD